MPANQGADSHSLRALLPLEDKDPLSLFLTGKYQMPVTSCQLYFRQAKLKFSKNFLKISSKFCSFQKGAVSCFLSFSLLICPCPYFLATGKLPSSRMSEAVKQEGSYSFFKQIEGLLVFLGLQFFSQKAQPSATPYKATDSLPPLSSLLTCVSRYHNRSNACEDLEHFRQ